MEKTKKPFYKKWWVWLIVIIIIGGIAAASGGNDSTKTSSNTSNSQTQTEQKPEPISVTTDALFKALDDNALQAADKYKNKYVKLTGKLSTIDSSGDYFTIGSDKDKYMFDTVLCNIDEEHLNKVKGFKKGQSVTVVGTITDVGEVLGYTLEVESIK